MLLEQNQTFVPSSLVIATCSLSQWRKATWLSSRNRQLQQRMTRVSTQPCCPEAKHRLLGFTPPDISKIAHSRTLIIHNQSPRKVGNGLLSKTATLHDALSQADSMIDESKHCHAQKPKPAPSQSKSITKSQPKLKTQALVQL